MTAPILLPHIFLPETGRVHHQTQGDCHVRYSAHLSPCYIHGRYPAHHTGRLGPGGCASCRSGNSRSNPAERPRPIVTIVRKWCSAWEGRASSESMIGKSILLVRIPRSLFLAKRCTRFSAWALRICSLLQYSVPHRWRLTCRMVVLLSCPGRRDAASVTGWGRHPQERGACSPLREETPHMAHRRSVDDVGEGRVFRTRE